VVLFALLLESLFGGAVGANCPYIYLPSKTWLISEMLSYSKFFGDIGFTDTLGGLTVVHT
jgi:hypothetical protein